MWKAFIELVRSYAEYNRIKIEAIQNPEPVREGCWARVTAIGTVAAAVLAGVAACVFWQQLQAMRDDTIATNRGWVIANTPQLQLRHLSSNRQAFAPSITISNIGNGPAADARSNFETFWFRPKLEIVGTTANMDVPSQHFPRNDTCKSVPTGAIRGTIWHKQPGASVIIGLLTEPPPDFYGAELLYGFHGCITYEVYGQVHYTRVCEFLTPNLGTSFSKWRWAFCPGEGQNDAN